jgi:hypothetical protein
VKLGAERKKVVALGVLGTAAAVLFYFNVLSGPETPASTPPPKASPAPSPKPGVKSVPAAQQQPSIRRAGRGRTNDEFNPKLPTKAEERSDPAKVDPMLRLDLLAKVQAVELSGGTRSLFQFAAAPPPPAEAAKAIKGAPVIKPGAAKPDAAESAAAAAKPSEPPPPPITLKFYGYSTARRDGVKRAFFLDGDDILIGAEGEMVKKRYKVVRIGVNSVVVEDTQFKNHQQTLVLQQEQAS